MTEGQRVKRKAVEERWTGGRIPYRFEPNFTGKGSFTPLDKILKQFNLINNPLVLLLYTLTRVRGAQKIT